MLYHQLMGEKVTEKLLQDILHRIDRNTVDVDFVVEVRAGGVAAHSDLGDLGPPFDNLSLMNQQRRGMAVDGADAVAMIDDHGVPQATFISGKLDHSGSGGHHGGAPLRGDVDSAVEIASVRNRRTTVTELARHPPLDRPDRWGRRGVEQFVFLNLP